MIPNFEFRIFIIMVNTEVNMHTELNIDRFHFDYPMIAVFVNYLNKLVDVHIFDVAVLCLQLLFLMVLINLSPITDFLLLFLE